MNETIEQFARQQIKDGLAKCTTDEQRKFKLMYSHQDLEKPIERVVDDMPSRSLDWALQQVENTLKRK